MPAYPRNCPFFPCHSRWPELDKKMTSYPRSWSFNMANVRVIVTFLVFVFSFGSCQSDITFEQDFWEMEVSYETWLRAGCIVSRSIPSARLVLTLTNANGTRLAMIQHNNINMYTQFMLSEFKTANNELSTKNKTAVGTSPDGEFLLYSAFKLNGSHIIASNLNGIEVTVRTDIRPTDVWNVRLNANGADIITCLPRIDCKR